MRVLGSTKVLGLRGANNKGLRVLVLVVLMVAVFQFRRVPPSPAATPIPQSRPPPSEGSSPPRLTPEEPTSHVIRGVHRRLVERNNGSVVSEELLLGAELERPHVSPGSIFVSMASYRDEQCLPTLIDMFDKARYPHKLFVGLVDQRAPGRGVQGSNVRAESMADDPCLDWERDCVRGSALAHTVLCRHVANVRILHVPHYMARGPTFGRFGAAMLRRNQTYFLLLDSHNRFTTMWDLRVRTQLTLLYKRNVSKPVLSHYPEGWANPEDVVNSTAPVVQAPHKPLDGRRTTSYLCKARFLQTGIPRLDGQIVTVTPDKRARPQPWAAAGFLFAPMRAITEVPFDPYLDYLFDGEEILYSVRLWTHGWDMYSPGENIVFHYYYRRKSKRVFIDSRGWLVPQLRSIHRVQHILKLFPISPSMNSRMRVPNVDPPARNSRVYRELERYGLGRTRSLEAYWEYAGGHPQTRIFTKDFCRLYING